MDNIDNTPPSTPPGSPPGTPKRPRAAPGPKSPPKLQRKARLLRAPGAGVRRTLDFDSTRADAGGAERLPATRRILSFSAGGASAPRCPRRGYSEAETRMQRLALLYHASVYLSSVFGYSFLLARALRSSPEGTELLVDLGIFLPETASEKRFRIAVDCSASARNGRC